MGNGYKLSQTIGMGGMDQRMDQRMEISDDNLRQGRLAMELWAKYPHFSLSLPREELVRIFGDFPSIYNINPDDPDFHETENDPETLNIFFAIVPKEMVKKFDGEETVAFQWGRFIFVSEETPEMYRHLAVLNLGMIRHSSKDPELLDFFDDKGIHVEDRSHWTSNLLDIFTAEYVFQDKPEELSKYLTWRASIERTDFYRDPEVEDYLQGKQDAAYMKLTTHPLRRGRFVAGSFRLAGSVAHSALSSRAKDAIASYLNPSRADIVFTRLLQDSSFSVFDMLATINTLLEEYEAGRRSFDFSNDPKLTRQAYLLTNEVLHDSFVLINTDPRNDIYKFRRQAQPTLRALRDRLSACTRDVMLKQVSPAELSYSMASRLADLLLGIKNIKVVAEGAKLQVDPDMYGPNLIPLLAGKQRSFEAAQAEIDALMDRYRALEEKMAALYPGKPVEVPAYIAAEMNSLQKRAEQLRRALRDIEVFDELNAMVMELKRDAQRSLDATAEMLDEPAGLLN